MEIFKQLEITIPLIEAIHQFPVYANVLKKSLKKKKFLDEGTIELQGSCSVILQNTLPPKVKDPGSFTIPYTIGDCDVGKVLIDVGASINLMSLSMLRKIGDLEVKPTKMVFQMTDRSTKNPYGVVKVVVVQVDTLKFPLDFVVMEMREDLKITIILGRSFMKTAKVVINVDDGVIMLKDQDEEVIFNVFNDEQLIQLKKTSPNTSGKRGFHDWLL
ncbi:uncharacterized protein LOC124834737 [Vigna umbellata]|uniref:uncharacterized protein LOC124834737 n=1 Tax=Vigna umbellata TaxID=87088 RepID=UPI001F5E4352|nr:uncharacterized protein LOC124834737 [Vigna umbellata]